MPAAAGIATRLAFWIGRERGRLIRATVRRLYDEIRADPVASRAGSARASRAGHAYWYVPEAAPGERLGAIVFLHGNGGNSTILPWAWRPFAESDRFAIIAPTFGLGFWGRGGVEAVDRALDDALARLPIDPARVFLGGISDGGKGVTRSATAHPGRYRGLIYVSPTMVPGELAAPAFVDAWRGRPVFVAQGGRDWNVRPATVDRGVALLRGAGCRVTYEVVPDEDHFLFFARTGELFEAIRRWMGTIGGPRPDDRPL